MPEPVQHEPHVYLDRSGELQHGCFFQVEFDEDVVCLEPADVLLKRETSESGLVRQRGGCDFACMFETGFDVQAEVRRACPVDETHVTQTWWRDLKVVVDPAPRQRVSPFVSMLSDAGTFAVLIHDDLLTLLKNSGLTGWSASEVTFALQSGRKFGSSTRPGRCPKLWDFQFRGSGRLRSRSIRAAADSCPFCGFGRVICPGCRWYMEECPRCKRWPTITQTRAAKLGDQVPEGTLIWEDRREFRRGILEGEHWDGNDFFQIACGSCDHPVLDDRQYITRRALDWLSARQAAPIHAMPVPVCIDRMSPDQLRQLERARDLSSLPS